MNSSEFFIYWNQCNQTKEFEACKDDYTRCIIYKQLRVLDRNKPKTGLERFIARYGESYLEMGVGASTEVPGEIDGEYKN